MNRNNATHTGRFIYIDTNSCRNAIVVFMWMFLFSAKIIMVISALTFVRSSELNFVLIYIQDGYTQVHTEIYDQRLILLTIS